MKNNGPYYVGIGSDLAHPGIISGPFDEIPTVEKGDRIYTKDGDKWIPVEVSIVIEVCQRLMDYHNVPNIVGDKFVGMRQAPKYHAQIKDKPGHWGCGVSLAEAIGSLIQNDPEAFGLKIEHLGKEAR